MTLGHADLDRLLQVALAWARGDRPGEGEHYVWAAAIARAGDEVEVVPLEPPMNWGTDKAMMWDVAGSTLWYRRDGLRATATAARLPDGKLVVVLEHVEGVRLEVAVASDGTMEVTETGPSIWKLP